MGIFSKLLGASSDIEKQLKDKYVPMFQMVMSLSLSQAENTFQDMLKRAKEESHKEGTINFPQNFGDILLKKEATDENIKSMFAKKRAEGVRDEDIRWWWNMHDLERRMITMTDNVFVTIRATHNLGKGMNIDKVVEKERKIFPFYGDPDDTTQITGDDRPLPPELRDRVDIYIIKRSQTNIENFKKEIEETSTVNALLRKEIKKGNI